MTEKTPEPAQVQLATADPPIVTVCMTLANLLAKGEGVTRADLARLLAAISTFYTKLGYVPPEFQGAINVPVPVEILTMIGKALEGSDQWSKTYNAARACAAATDKARWQRLADEVKQRHPRQRFSKTALAQIIAPNEWERVRKLIT